MLRAGSAPVPEAAHEQCITALAEDPLVAALVKEHPCLRLFCTHATYSRYLRARKWSVPKAAKMLHATLEWRLSFQPHAIQWADVSEEAQHGKQQVWSSADRAGRPIYIFRPRLEHIRADDQSMVRQVKFLVYHLEVLSALADHSGVGVATWMMDMGGKAPHNRTNLTTVLECLHILQNHYPERLGLAVLYHTPTLFWITWKAMSPFLDPVTKSKVLFVGSSNGADMAERFDLSLMEPCFTKFGVPDQLFDAKQYNARMEAYDAQGQAALLAVKAGEAASIRGPPGLAVPVGAA